MKNFISGIKLLVSLSLIIWLSGCSDNDPKSTEKGTLTIEFDNSYREDDLALGTTYTNSSNEEYTITKLNYYVSNFMLTSVDGKEYVIPADSCYFLIREADAESQEVMLKNIPAGDYNKIEFIIGIDSLRNTMDVSQRKGVLDLGYEEVMYWTWNSGYIFFMMEGTSEAASGNDNAFQYHIGGYGGYSQDSPTLNNIRKKTIDMGSAKALVRSDKSPKVHLHVDISEFFSNPTSISIAEHPAVHSISAFSATVADNYVNLFKFGHVHN